jgi:hypothetical protein
MARGGGLTETQSHGGGRLDGLTPEVLESIVDRIPAGRMSDMARRFTIELVKFNRSRIMGLRF